MSVAGKLFLRVAFAEVDNLDLAGRAANHLLEYPGDLKVGGEYASGAGSYQQDTVFSDRRSVASGTPDDLDLYGGLTNAFGTAINHVEVAGLMIVNRSTTAGQILEVGGDAAPSFAGLFGDASDKIKVQPGGCLFWFSPLDGSGLTVTNTTADILQIASASGTISYDIVVWGRLS